MIKALRLTGAEPAWAIACAIGCFVPLLRIPSGLLLLCLLPGLAFCRRRLGEPSIPRRLILGSVFSLALVPVVAIPLALLLGRPGPLVAVASALAVTLAAAGRRSSPTASVRAADAVPLAGGRGLAVVLILALAMQFGASIAIHPNGDTLRWRGTPDYFFFQGVYTQTALHTPPMDPENGSDRLVHNWIYHFHFAQIETLTGLSTATMQRVVSAWLALTLLGLVHLICSDLLSRPAAGWLASLLLMTSGEIRWLARSLKSVGFSAASMGWTYAPFGILLLFSWYNMAPLVMMAAAWYTFERHRVLKGGGAWLNASLFCCVAMAFFHPVLFASFMAGFVPYLAWLWLRGERGRRRLAFLATPLPFALLYVLPYYSTSLPPVVIHFDPSAASMMTRALTVLQMHGAAFLPAIVGAAVAGVAGGGLPFLMLGPLAGWILLKVPNVHWFSDPLFLTLAIAAGSGLSYLISRWRAAGTLLAVGLLSTGAVAFSLHLGTAFSGGHTYSADERAAADWLLKHADADALIAAIPNSPASYPILGLARRRLIHGWTTHLLDFRHDARTREEEAFTLLTTSDPQQARELARGRGVDFVWRGPEADRAGPGGGLDAECFPEVFTSETVRIRAFQCAGK